MCIAISPETLLEKTFGASYGFSFFAVPGAIFPRTLGSNRSAISNFTGFTRKPGTGHGLVGDLSNGKLTNWDLISWVLDLRIKLLKNSGGSDSWREWNIGLCMDMRCVWCAHHCKKQSTLWKKSWCVCFWVVSFWNHSHLNRVWCSVLSNCAVW